LIHCHAYGDATKVASLVLQFSERIYGQISEREEDEVGRVMAEYELQAERVASLSASICTAQGERDAATMAKTRHAAEAKIGKQGRQREKAASKLVERDERVAESRRRAEEDRQDVAKVGEELAALYADPDELLKHARVVSRAEVEENEFNLNIPRYVDTFEPEPRMDVKEALEALRGAEGEATAAEKTLTALLSEIGYETN
jgi:type I restriction enzyme M protein